MRSPTWWSWAMRYRAAIRKLNAYSMNAFRLRRWRRCSRKNFWPDENRWWWRERTERQPPPACWRGYTRRPDGEPSFLIGGVAENFGTSFQLRPTRTFILEGDEYDTAFFDKGPKFLHYFPDALILTHVEFDHADIYADLEAVKTAFKRLVNLVPRRGVIVAYDGNANVTECVARAFCRVERYGFTAEAHWRIQNLRHEDGLTRWEVWREGALWAELEMGLAGEHNALNATAAAALAAGQGIGKEAIQAALASFKSVKRRLEVRAEIGGVTIIDDFAHHPTAIRETLRALRSVYPKSRLWAVLEPRSNTLRRKVLEGEIVASLRPRRSCDPGRGVPAGAHS